MWTSHFLSVQAIWTMQLIGEYYSISEAEQVQRMLREKGILTHISSARSYNLSGYVTGAFKVGLWSIFDNQYHDACLLLAGDQCIVRHPLTEEQMVELDSVSKRQSPGLILKGLTITLIILSVIIIAIFIIAK